MISLKKLITFASVAVLSLSLFAQQSKTNAATAGLFGNDVDDYMDVCYWSGVKPEKFFAYFGMDSNRAGNTYDLGFAKQFSKVYWGTYYSGNLGVTNRTKTTLDSNTTVETTSGESEFTFNNIFGFGDTGLLLSFDYYDDGNSTKTTTSSTTNLTDNKVWTLGLKAGKSEYTFKNINLIPYVGASFSMNSNGGSKVVTDNGITSTTVDTRNWALFVEAGADLPFGKSELVEQTASFGSNIAFANPVDSDLKTKSTIVYFPVGYKAIVKASDSLSLGFRAIIAPGLGSEKYSEDHSAFGIGFESYVSAGLTYSTKKNLDFNVGVEFDVPEFYHRKETTKVGDSKKTESTSSWDGDDGKLTFTSGFAFKPTKNICIDCSYAIINDLLGDDTDTDLTTGNFNFWNTVNKVLVHNIGFTVIVKF